MGPRVPSQHDSEIEVQVSFQDAARQGLSVAAQSRLAELVNDYASELRQEAGRLEAGDRRTGLDAEITASHVTSADEVVRRPVVMAQTRGSKTLDRFLPLVASVAGGTAGVLGGYLTRGWFQALVFGVFATVALGAVVLSFVRSK